MKSSSDIAIKVWDLVVIGGGPSGMMCAGRAGEVLGGGQDDAGGKKKVNINNKKDVQLAKILLLEKNEKLGQKLSITGGGRCNITNAEFDNRAFLSNFPEAKEFLFSPFSKFSAKDTFTFFESKGLSLVVEARKRAFPETQKASDVMHVMERYVKDNGVAIKTGVQVVSVTQDGDNPFLIKTKDGEKFYSRHIAFATGGLARVQERGVSAGGFSILQKLGHTIKASNPNIVPLTTSAKWVHAISGVTLSFMAIRFKQNGVTKLKKTGKILFTHFGISGPLILNSSFEVKKLLANGSVEASIDLFPDTEENELDRRVWRLFEQNKNKKLKNSLPEMMESSLAEQVLNLPDIKLAEKEANAVTKEERKKLVKKMKNLTFPITGTLGLEHAVIASGGVPPEEVDFRTMVSRVNPNLYLLGDGLDSNRPSGGFSLQLCWTTGFVAGTDIANKIRN